MMRISIAMIAVSAIWVRSPNAQIMDRRQSQLEPPMKEQCQVLANSVAFAARSLVEMEKSLTVMRWQVLIREAPSGEIKKAAETASIRQAPLQKALRSYRESLEDLVYQLQLCAR